MQGNFKNHSLLNHKENCSCMICKAKRGETKGKNNPFYGKHNPCSEERKRKIGESNKGEKHWNWRGGIAEDTYSLDWTETLRRSIRERDKYTCVICLKQQTEEVYSVHHIDYNKLNSNPINLITLCRSCHVKTNYNRNYWKKYFKIRNKNE